MKASEVIGDAFKDETPECTDLEVIGDEDLSVMRGADIVRDFVDPETVGNAFEKHGYSLDAHVSMLMGIINACELDASPSAIGKQLSAMKQLMELQKDVVKSKETLAKLNILSRTLDAVGSTNTNIKLPKPKRKKIDARTRESKDKQDGGLRRREENFYGNVHLEPELPQGQEKNHGGIRPQGPTEV